MWKFNPQFFAIDGNELDRGERAARRILNLFGNVESFQDRPGRGIDAIAADFFARKFFALENKRSQSGCGAKRGTSRTGGSATDDRNIENFHYISLCCHVERSRDISKYFRNGKRFLHFGRNDMRLGSLPPEHRWRAI